MGARVLTLEQASNLYAIPLTDYGPSKGAGLLVSSGCGMMLAIMDCCSMLRWCVDIDGVRDQRARLADFLLCAEKVVAPLAVCGWFSISDPKPLRDALMALAGPVVVYGGNVRFGVPGEAETLERFIRMISESATSNSIKRPRTADC
jgi:hypothetical protein